MDAGSSGQKGRTGEANDRGKTRAGFLPAGICIEISLYTIVVSPLSPRRKGEISVLLSTVFWSLFPVITILTYSSLPPLTVGGIGALISSLFFAAMLTIRGRWPELAERRAWKGILFASFYTGIIYYTLVFLGLRATTAGNEAIVLLMEVFFTFLILGVLLKHEKLVARTALGGACMVAGALVILFPKASGWHSGDLLVLLATVFAPLGNKSVKDARRFVSAETIMFCRGIIGGATLLFLGAVTETWPPAHVFGSAIGFLLANGILTLGIPKILWIEGINLLPITKAISISSISPVLTLIIAFFVLHESITMVQILGLLPIITGMFLLTRQTGMTESVSPMTTA